MSNTPITDFSDGESPISKVQDKPPLRKGSFVPKQDEVYYTWENVNFSVPLKETEKQMIEERQSQAKLGADQASPQRLMEEIIKKKSTGRIKVSRKDQNKKQILDNVTGYARPREMVAIMGASGSGKTSLLNILGQRLDLSKGASCDATIKCNDKEIGPKDFGKLGAFVMQDDILIETLTPFESFIFAAKLRTNLSHEEIIEKANQMVIRLQLSNCQNTRIGGTIMKGISGGERKRTCIGYELITEPSLLLLDEPTSGLDASTAHRIIKMLQREAANGMTIIATIHQPSGEVFQLFDRLIVLQDGCQVYQGPVSQLKGFFGDLGCNVGTFVNPADYVIKLAQVPELCADALTDDRLEDNFETKLRPAIDAEISKDQNKFSAISTKLDMFGDDRKVGICTQYAAIFDRDWTGSLRNPRALRATYFQAVFVGLLLLGMYWHIGDSFSDYEQVFIDPDVTTVYTNYVTNLSGLAFILGTNVQFALSASSLLQMPLQVPVYRREQANEMYKPSMYYLARYTSQLILLIWYPILMQLIVVYAVKIDTSIENVGYMMMYGILLGFVSISQGWFIGSCTDNNTVAGISNSFVTLLLMLCSGGMGSILSFPWYIEWLQYCSPLRYGFQGIVIRILQIVPEGDNQLRTQTIQGLGFDKLTDKECIGALVGIGIAFFIGGWVVTELRTIK